ncbi:MAG TPA: nucleotide sugar dehydrogenase [Caulobacteraceae bacterium]|nr:nucleotide sugar dehydrogenase [Caulobacteraceae bacterium]
MGELESLISNVVVVGCGHIGLPLALALGEAGASVRGVEIDPARLAALAGGRLDPDHEDMSRRLQGALGSGALAFADAPGRSTAPRTFILTVPTPVDGERRFVRGPLDRAVAAVTAVANAGDLIVVRSTVPIGTTRALAAGAADGLLWAACPDRSVAGRAFADQFEIPHLIGGLDDAADAAARSVFSMLGETRSVASPETAEAVKLFANAHRDVAFALANQFALICEATGIDFAEVREAGSQGFARFSLARAGPVGGPCLSKDLFLLAAPLELAPVETDLLWSARNLNEGLARRLCARVAADLDASGAPRRAAVLGLAFKGRPAVSDRADSFGVAIAAALAACDPPIAVTAWDPVSDPPAGRAAALAGASLVVLANDHPALADLSEIARAAPGAVVYDLCGISDRGSAAGLALRVFGDGTARR